MPKVDYECTNCGNTFSENRQFVDPDSKVVCPKCGTKHPKRVLNTFKQKFLNFFSPGAQDTGCAECGG